MKKILCVFLSLFLLCGFANAESLSLEEGSITLLAEGDEIDLDGDGVKDSIEYEIFHNEGGYDTGYRLKVGDSEITGTGESMNEEINLLLLDSNALPLLLISDYGPSDDYVTHFYSYENGSLQLVGSINSLPELMRVKDGVITAPVRGKVMYTWFHDADFAVARSLNENDPISVTIHEIPRSLYAMSLIVTLKVDLPLSVSMTNTETACTLKSGEQVVLCATDDLEWVYIESLESDAAGWLRLDRETGYECIVGDQILFSYDVFDGLLFAD